MGKSLFLKLSKFADVIDGKLFQYERRIKTNPLTCDFKYFELESISNYITFIKSNLRILETKSIPKQSIYHKEN